MFPAAAIRLEIDLERGYLRPSSGNEYCRRATSSRRRRTNRPRHNRPGPRPRSRPSINEETSNGFSRRPAEGCGRLQVVANARQAPEERRARRPREVLRRAQGHRPFLSHGTAHVLSARAATLGAGMILAPDVAGPPVARSDRLLLFHLARTSKGSSEDDGRLTRRSYPSSSIPSCTSFPSPPLEGGDGTSVMRGGNQGAEPDSSNPNARQKTRRLSRLASSGRRSTRMQSAGPAKSRGPARKCVPRAMGSRSCIRPPCPPSAESRQTGLCAGAPT